MDSLLVALIPWSTLDGFHFRWSMYFFYLDRPVTQAWSIISTFARAKIIRALEETEHDGEKAGKPQSYNDWVMFQTPKDQINADVASS